MLSSQSQPDPVPQPHPGLPRVPLPRGLLPSLSPGISTLRISIQSMIMWRTCIPSTCALDLHGSADNPSLNGTLCHQDLDLALCHRAQAKVDKYQEGYAAPGLRHAFLPAIVSTSGRIHGELLRLLFNLAYKKTSNYFVALGEAFGVGRPRSRPRAATRSRA